MIDFNQVKLGRTEAKHDTLRRAMATSFLETVPRPPESVDNTNGQQSWGMMLNNELGDCTIAGLGHSIQVATMNTGAMQTPTDAQILSGYETYCGYNPANPATDQGGNELDILTQVEAASTGFCGRLLLGYVSPDPKNIDHVKKAIAYFGSVYMGCALPVSAQTQKVWDVTGHDGGVWGGHCMINAKYDSEYIPFITWGENQPATWAWWMKYVDECHCLVWDVWLKKFPASTQQTIIAMMHAIS